MEWERQLCLEAPSTDAQVLHLAECSLISTYQQWEFLYYTDNYNSLIDPSHVLQNPTDIQRRMQIIMELITSGNIQQVNAYLNRAL